MRDYSFSDLEAKWQDYWQKNKTFAAKENTSLPKYYVLDMFPYPSGAGLHVGHPLGYIASDIIARYKRLCGFNVLHPMGYDSFGLPAEQYAIQTGQHPAITTQQNVKRYREQLDKIGFSFDWSREVSTSDPAYYRWTQWIFRQIFESFYDIFSQKAEPITALSAYFSAHGSAGAPVRFPKDFAHFDAVQWNAYSCEEQYAVLLDFRLAQLQQTQVNWCPALGTVLANDEVINGRSERGGHPVVQKKMWQWNLGMQNYAQRLLDNLEQLDWSDAIKEQQRNWIGRSTGARVFFQAQNGVQIPVYTTRPDTLYGVSFLGIAADKLAEYFPEITDKALEKFIQEVLNTSERERLTARNFRGYKTDFVVKNPLTGAEIPVVVADYILSSYGTGAVMGCPAGDARDHALALELGLPILPIFDQENGENPCERTDAVLVNSPLWNGLSVPDAIRQALQVLEEKGCGSQEVNFRLRDAGFSRQRYWGEPFPVYYKTQTVFAENRSLPYLTPEDFPVVLPAVDQYLPTEQGQPPLARAEEWFFTDKDGQKYPLECNTMPGWAGSSWYFLRYMDPQNAKEFAGAEALNYWQQVDLYVGGAEHATGHLLYARFWNLFLYDRGFVPFAEPFKKLVNQGMILGRSSLMYRVNNTHQFVSKNKKEGLDVSPIHVNIALVKNDVLDIAAYKNWEFAQKDATFICEDNGEFICDFEIEKMSKSKHNVQTPDELVQQFGADTLRCYEMFLGPLEQFKPWDVQGINGTHNFLRKFARLFSTISDEKPDAESLKTLHRTIKRVQEDIERFSLNTVVSTLMIAVNELTQQGCHHRAVLAPLTILLSPYAPHLAEELWALLGNTESISFASFPVFDPQILQESTFEYPISFNGKTRFQLCLPLEMDQAAVEEAVRKHPLFAQYTQSQPVKKMIVVKGRIVNVVV